MNLGGLDEKMGVVCGEQVFLWQEKKVLRATRDQYKGFWGQSVQPQLGREVTAT